MPAYVELKNLQQRRDKVTAVLRKNLRYMQYHSGMHREAMREGNAAEAAYQTQKIGQFRTLAEGVIDGRMFELGIQEVGLEMLDDTVADILIDGFEEFIVEGPRGGAA